MFHPASRHGQLRRERGDGRSVSRRVGRRARLPLSGGWRRARKAGYALAMLLAIAMTWSCKGGSVAPAAVALDPGFLTVEWTGPAAARDSGVLLELEGPDIEDVRGAPGTDRWRRGGFRSSWRAPSSASRINAIAPAPALLTRRYFVLLSSVRENRGTARPCRASRLNTTAPPGKGVATRPGVNRPKRPLIYR